jgi:flavin-binding protein dodecin
MKAAIEELQDAGVEPDIWKIEGIDRREDCESISATTRRDGRDGVACVVLGRGADDAAVDHWLRMGSGVPGYIGFAIGRSIWWDPLKGFVDGNLGREDGREADRRQLPAVHRRLSGEVGVAMAVIKTIDLVGVSSESWRDAAHQALSEASKTIRGIESMDILGTSAVVADGQISEYHTQVRISFRIERS